jgi:hypothetical protein
MNEKIRKLALALLNDDYGISGDALDLLSDFLIVTGNNDIMNAVDECKGRFFVSEDFAEENEKVA